MMDQATKDLQDFSLASSPSHLLHRAQQLAANQSAEALRDAGVTLRQFSLLAAIEEAEGVSQSHLVDTTGIDRSTLADMVARMERADLISRKESAEDARAKSVWLTEKGRNTLGRARPAVAAADAELLNALPKNRRASFLSILAVLADVSDRQILQLEADESGGKKKVKSSETENFGEKAAKSKKKPEKKKETKKKKKKKS